jgi:hypothetical protein
MMGPGVWADVAQELESRGRTAIVPSLAAVADAPPPQWPVAVETVREAADSLDGPVLLAGHSAAGILLPRIAAAVRHEVPALMFVDCLLPPSAGSAPVGPPPLMAWLRTLATKGRVPPLWDWFGDEVMSELVRDEDLRAKLEAEMPSFPVTYFDSRVEMPDGWGDRPSGYVLLGHDFYGATAENARNRGWPVIDLGGGHFAPATRPAAVTDALLELEEVLTTAPARPRSARPGWPAGTPGGTA